MVYTGLIPPSKLTKLEKEQYLRSNNWNIYKQYNAIDGYTYLWDCSHENRMFWPDFIRNQYINRTTGWLLDDAVYLQQYIDKEVVVEKGDESATKLRS